MILEIPMNSRLPKEPKNPTFAKHVCVCVCVPISLNSKVVGKLGVCMFFLMIHIQLSPKTCGQEGLMPKIVSGVSGGSIVAGFLAIHTDEEKLG